MAPFNMSGITFIKDPRMIQYIASLHVRPTAMIEEGACQPCAFSASEIQNPRMVRDVQVLLLSGVTSLSMFDHLSGSAKLVVCLGNAHPAGVFFFSMLVFVRLTRSLRKVVMIG